MKLVIRLLGDDGQLLGWTEHLARARGDGTLRASADIVVPIEQSGFACFISVHWCELNVEVRTQAPQSLPVKVGDNVRSFAYNEVMITAGKSADGLPPVTVRKNVAIVVPTLDMIFGG